MPKHGYARGFSLILSIVLILGSALLLPFGSIGSRAMADELPTATTVPASDEAARQTRFREMEIEQLRWRAKRAHLMDLVFANSAAWPRFEDLPPAFSGAVDDDTVSALLHTLGAGEGYIDPELWSKFRKIDLGSDVGLIYTGDALDREGSRTTVWPSYGAILSDGNEEAPWPIRVNRVKQGMDPWFTGVVEGCCADSLEAFYRADLLRADGAEVVRSSKYLEIPDGTADVRLPVILKREADFTLRFSPAVDDSPAVDPDAPNPAIGNVARKLNGIFDAVTLMGFTDEAGKQWVLIQTTLQDDQSAHYNDPGQPPVDVGWIDASSIGLSEPQNRPLISWLRSHGASPKADP